MIKYNITPFSALCSLRTFTIVGQDVQDHDDFYTQQDESPHTAEDYACGYMKGTPMKATPKVLKKYGLTTKEFNQIAEEAAEAVSFGCCGLCT
jgi:hypothetical protein